jgi:hypothetical protein
VRAEEFFKIDHPDPDSLACFIKYSNFCWRRHGAPLSTPEEFHKAWKIAWATVVAERRKRQAAEAARPPAAQRKAGRP